jgi:hypothetical protein
MRKKKDRPEEVPRLLVVTVPLARGSDEATAARFAGMVGAVLDDFFESMRREGVAHPAVGSNVAVERGTGRSDLDVRALH